MLAALPGSLTSLDLSRNAVGGREIRAALQSQAFEVRELASAVAAGLLGTLPETLRRAQLELAHLSLVAPLACVQCLADWSTARLRALSVAPRRACERRGCRAASLTCERDRDAPRTMPRSCGALKRRPRRSGRRRALPGALVGPTRPASLGEEDRVALLRTFVMAAVSDCESVEPAASDMQHGVSGAFRLHHPRQMGCRAGGVGYRTWFRWWRFA